MAWARCHDIPTLRGVTIRAALEWRGVGFRSGFGVAWNYQNQFNSNSIQFQFLSNPGGVAWRGGFGWGLLRRGVGHATPESQVALAGLELSFLGRRMTIPIPDHSPIPHLSAPNVIIFVPVPGKREIIN